MIAPYEETFIRVTMLLDEPDARSNRNEIAQHLDTMIDLSGSDEEKRAAYDFKAMALNHLDSIGVDEPDITEQKRVRGMLAGGAVQRVIEERRRL